MPVAAAQSSLIASLPPDALDLYRAPIAGRDAKLKFKPFQLDGTLALKPFGFDYQDAFGKVVHEVPDLVDPPTNQQSHLQFQIGFRLVHRHPPKSIITWLNR
jgi:hypothetical protein